MSILMSNNQKPDLNQDLVSINMFGPRSINFCKTGSTQESSCFDPNAHSYIQQLGTNLNLDLININRSGPKLTNFYKIGRVQKLVESKYSLYTYTTIFIFFFLKYVFTTEIKENKKDIFLLGQLSQTTQSQGKFYKFIISFILNKVSFYIIIQFLSCIFIFITQVSE